MSYQCQTAVLLIIFNRPDRAKKVLDGIAAVRPPKLYISADGPRPEKPEDRAICERTRQEVLDYVSWPCEVHTQFHEENLGCKMGPVSGITWMLNREGRGIILEDDCYPIPDFFRFCEEMLDRYQDEPKVMHISGSNFHFGKAMNAHSYYFSRINHGWGWATWKRAWDLFEPDLPTLDKDLASGQVEIRSKEELNYFLPTWKKAATIRFDIWDFLWTYTMWKYHGVAIVPNRNLISNIGYGADATHTVLETKLMAMPTQPLAWPLNHPPKIEVSYRADHKIWRRFYVQPLFMRFKWQVKQLLKRAAGK